MADPIIEQRLDIEDKRLGSWFLSVSGRQLWPFDLRPEDIEIEEIAHSLSHLCRFNGHCREFYSVAQHSLIVSTVLPDEHKLCGLLHDATEAYCGDLVRPIKRRLPAFAEMEAGIWLAVAARFGLPTEMPPAIKEADSRALQTERRDLLAPHRWRWTEDHVEGGDVTRPYDFSIDPLPPALARQEFLREFHALVSRHRPTRERGNE